MEDNEESGLFNFSDDLVPTSEPKKDKKEFTLEDWICRKSSVFLYNCISSHRSGLPKLEQYLSYDWDHPSEAAKKALAQQLDFDNPNHPLEAIAKSKDPTGGRLLKLCLDNSKITVESKFVDFSNYFDFFLFFDIFGKLTL